MKKHIRTRSLLLFSFVLAGLVIVFGGLRETETPDIIELIATISATMGGFGLVSFSIARASDELRNDFIDSSIVMILSTVASFFFLVFPEKSLWGTNFGELSIFLFFWAFLLLLITLIDRRFKVLT